MCDPNVLVHQQLREGSWRTKVKHWIRHYAPNTIKCTASSQSLPHTRPMLHIRCGGGKGLGVFQSHPLAQRWTLKVFNHWLIKWFGSLKSYQSLTSSPSRSKRISLPPKITWLEGISRWMATAHDAQLLPRARITYSSLANLVRWFRALLWRPSAYQSPTTIDDLWTLL